MVNLKCDITTIILYTMSTTALEDKFQLEYTLLSLRECNNESVIKSSLMVQGILLHEKRRTFFFISHS